MKPSKFEKPTDALTDENIQDRFMGKRINRNIAPKCRINILESLYVMTYQSSKQFKKPIGFHVRVRFTEKLSLRTFSARISTFYKRKSGYTPIRISAREDDPDDNGVHYHFAFIIDGRYDTKTSIQHFLAELKKSNLVADYKVISPKDNPHGQDLRNEFERDHFFCWLSYLAKSETKEVGKQALSHSKSIKTDIKNWKKLGKPVLASPSLQSTPGKAQASIIEQFMLDPVGVHRPPRELAHNITTAACRAL